MKSIIKIFIASILLICFVGCTNNNTPSEGVSDSLPGGDPYYYWICPFCGAELRNNGSFRKFQDQTGLGQCVCGAIATCAFNQGFAGANFEKDGDVRWAQENTYRPPSRH